MEEVLQFVSVDIPHAVEITGSEPVGIEDLLRLRATDTIEQKALELIIRQAIRCTRTDVVIVLPELSRHFRTTYPLQKTAAIFHCSPFQHAADRYMEHNRIIVLQYRWIKDS